MKNFPFEYEGKTYWYSRSVACSMYLFVKEKSTGNWYILVSKRGPGCPSAVGKWNVPGGYLDFDETLAQAAMRECFEETGVEVIEPVTLASISTNLDSKKQNIVCSFFAIKEVENIKDIKTSTEHCENNEVDEILFLDVREFRDGWGYWNDRMAFGHDLMIREIFNKRVNISFFKKWLLKITEKMTKINLKIS